jgi:hypothetical protein
MNQLDDELKKDEALIYLPQPPSRLSLKETITISHLLLFFYTPSRYVTSGKDTVDKLFTVFLYLASLLHFASKPLFYILSKLFDG